MDEMYLKAIEYGTTNIQKIEAIDRMIDKKVSQQKDELLQKVGEIKIDVLSKDIKPEVVDFAELIMERTKDEAIKLIKKDA